MDTSRQGDAGSLDGRMPRRLGATDPAEDARERRREEFRRFLVSVAGPAFAELRAWLRADGRDVRLVPGTQPGGPAEATIAVSHRGEPEFACALRAAVTPERAVVLKRRPVPSPAGVREEEAPLLAAGGPASDARAVTRAEVVASVRADYEALRRAREAG